MSTLPSPSPTPIKTEPLAWKNVPLFLLTGGAVVLCGLIAWPFLAALTGAVTIAVITHRPYHQWLEARCRNRTLAATAALVAVVVSLITPLTILAIELVKQALAAATVLRSGIPQQKLAAVLAQHATIAARLQTLANQVDLDQATQKGASYAASQLGALLGNSFGAITQLVLMLFLLFFLYRDRAVALTSLRNLLPMEEADADAVLQTATDAIYATASGRLVVSLVQGILAGLAYWALGVEGALLWGFATVLAAMVPLVGAFFIWVPIALYFVMTGAWGHALLLAIWGGLVVSSIDNYLYPVLVGARIKMHTAAILIAVLGGLTLFGVPGLILGPLLLSVTQALLAIWARKAAFE